MARPRMSGKLYASFTLLAAKWACRKVHPALFDEDHMAPIAIAMFIALFAFGAKYFGWDDADGKIQLALVTSFILGIISGYKVRS